MEMFPTLGKIDKVDEDIAEINVQYEQERNAVLNYIDALAADEYVLDALNQHPNLIADINIDDVLANISNSRIELVNSVNRAINARKKIIDSVNTQEGLRDRLISGEDVSES